LKSKLEFFRKNIKIRKDRDGVKDLHLKIEIEQLISSIALQFVHVTPAEIDRMIESCLDTIVQFAKADRGYIYLFEDDNKQLQISHQFNQPEIKEKISRHERVDGEDFSWLVDSILEKSTINISSLSQIPERAKSIQLILEAEKIKSMILCPLTSNDNVSGIIGFDSVNQEREWSTGIEHLIKICGDIFMGAIARKRAVYLGKQSEQKLRTLFSKIEDVIFISTPDGKFLDINPAGAKLFGYSSIKKLLNVNIVEDLYVNPNDRIEFHKKLEMRGQLKDYELELKTKDDKKIMVLATATVLRNESGDTVAYEGILRDVTEQRHLEQQFFQAQKMESIGLLAGGVAHDFNNILTTITGYAELMLMDMDETNPNRNDVNNIIEGGKRAENLIRQLLAFSRKQMIQTKIIDINKEISELYKMLSRLIAEDIKFELNLKKNLSSIKADPVQIQQILVNLIVNAGHAIKERKDKTNLKYIKIITSEINLTREFTRQHPGSSEGKHVVITIEDTGIGMDKETMQKIFDPFYTTKRDGEGTGLGLATVYGIVKQNKSSIYVESQPGIGSSFKIYWPASEEEKTVDSKIDSHIHIEPHNETLLVVEDDFHVRNLNCEALKSFGYTIHAANNGKHALEIIKKDSLIDKIDLVITDMVMPEMGGEELAERLREINPQMKILLCSGYTDSHIVSKDSVGIRGYYFLAKPYSLKELEKKIRHVLSKSV
jgi:two-component system cell cycle sensor histidine kinase/response regulator CckA